LPLLTLATLLFLVLCDFIAGCTGATAVLTFLLTELVGCIGATALLTFLLTELVGCTGATAVLTFLLTELVGCTGATAVLTFLLTVLLFFLILLRGTSSPAPCTITISPSELLSSLILSEGWVVGVYISNVKM